MATYKKGYKKQNPETVLLKVILGIIVAVALFVGTFYIYDISTEWKDYENYTAITTYKGMLEFANGGDEALEDYVVYFYSNKDSSNNIKVDVLRNAKDINKDSEMFFLADINAMTDADAELEDFLDAIELDSLSAPLLLVVADGEFYGVYSGSEQLLDVLASIEEGTFEAFN